MTIVNLLCKIIVASLRFCTGKAGVESALDLSRSSSLHPRVRHQLLGTQTHTLPFSRPPPPCTNGHRLCGAMRRLHEARAAHGVLGHHVGHGLLDLQTIPAWRRRARRAAQVEDQGQPSHQVSPHLLGRSNQVDEKNAF